MFKDSAFPLPKIILFCVLAFATLVFSIDANAQEENSPRHIEKPSIEENTPVQENIQPSFPLFKPAPTKQATTANMVKRELPATGIIQERELKKTESPSTLSFNIFLYIVDKFKED
jgi:hypothetical protein